MIRKRLLAVSLGAAVAIATPLVAWYEGKENTAYIDPVGIPTICYGHTGTAKLGQTYSDKECEELLAQDLGTAFDAVDRYTRVTLPAERRAALASFVFNVGEYAFSNSTLLRKLNSGDTSGACAELDRWVYGRKNGIKEVLPGLVKRRATERELCEVGL